MRRFHFGHRLPAGRLRFSGRQQLRDRKIVDEGGGDEIRHLEAGHSDLGRPILPLRQVQVSVGLIQ